MGIKGRRVHMIEELSETIISFQRGKIDIKVIGGGRRREELRGFWLFLTMLLECCTFLTGIILCVVF